MKYRCPVSESRLEGECPNTTCMWYGDRVTRTSKCILDQMRLEDVEFNDFASFKSGPRVVKSMRAAQESAQNIQTNIILDKYLLFLTPRTNTPVENANPVNYTRVVEKIPKLLNPFFLQTPSAVFPQFLSSEKWKKFQACNPIAKGYKLYAVLGISPKRLSVLQKEYIDG